MLTYSNSAHSNTLYSIGTLATVLMVDAICFDAIIVTLSVESRINFHVGQSTLRKKAGISQRPIETTQRYKV